MSKKVIYSIRILAIFSFVLISAVFQRAQATHLRAGEIIVRRVSCSELTFEITIRVYTDTGTDVRFGEGVLSFGDGSEPFIIPQQENDNRSDLGPEVATASYTILHTYSSSGKYKIGYVEPNRNEGVLNIDNSVNTTFYVETEINIDPFLGCNNSPVLLIPPIDRACQGVAFFHNPGAYDPDGDSISFELVVPQKDVGSVVNGYEDPNDAMFYDNPSQGNENQDGSPTFTIDPISGELKWDSPGRTGEYNIAFIVKEYRQINGQWRELGFVTRDMQIIVEECDNERPELEIPEDICVEAGETINEIIFGSDPDNDPVKIEAFSQVFDLGATVEPDSAIFQPSNGANLKFNWETECLDIRDQPYQVVFKITDKPPMGPKLVSFATWNITVIGPAPDLTGAVQQNQSIILNWDTYSCQNADGMQIYRRVDSNPYEPEECETGIREGSGFQLLATVGASAQTYRDDDLDPGAKYCYRIVATFPTPFGGESIVSQEVCAEPVLATEPVITNVTVDITDETNGKITVAWREPFDLGTLVAPLTYRIYRSQGQSGSGGRQLIRDNFTVATTDSTVSTFNDSGLNTTGLAYNYEVALVDGADEVLSAKASSVRLEPTPQLKKIELRWDAVVPWSNTIVSPPDDSKHFIYRGNEGDTEADLILIDSVDVVANGFIYVDEGQFNNTPLRDDRLYCYRVLTKGTYGNPAIHEPLLNFSQIVCAQPSDSIPPCAPVISINETGCEKFIANNCNLSGIDLNNEVTWTTDFTGDCQDDVQVYELYYASGTTEEFSLLATVNQESYIHDNLNSFKGCYKVRAIDRSGNVSEFSETFCVDNCPYYELPNLFTPNGDGCNDLFSAYGSQSENGAGNCGTLNEPSKCARFVKSVKLTILNRWGGTVYTYEGVDGTEKGIYINWNGRDENGRELSSGVYYYLAEVTFDVVDPSKARQKLKGWVQIIR